MSLVETLARLDVQVPSFEPGHVWLAGAGPGHLAGLTLEVVAAIGQADAIVYDALVDAAVLKAAPQAERHYVGKRAGQPSASQSFINELIVRLARENKRVLRLKGGDPNVFGRGGEEASALSAVGVPFRFLPGVTSAFAALAAAGMPATLRGVNKAIILATGHGIDDQDHLDWASLTRTGQPIVVYMGMSNLPIIVAGLRDGGLADTTPVAVIQGATTVKERLLVSELAQVDADVRAAGIVPPALIVVGEIVRHRHALGSLMREVILP
ncbi:uroporphyrinogen-III C-methyltransferase [Tianweitania populi]|uniref:uroporphyrinogen-III C-methyltransferase n=1 Tax=Tianweitania populi TaxID=1607949 RepID=A0A8J3DUL6_9HYPH|nr:uroporphyrinogen-III C-methyltransferase [Tianweitania populi]GHD08630.1 uroporphyrin-III C-methyltransferase [Tianweitania populi]